MTIQEEFIVVHKAFLSDHNELALAVHALSCFEQALKYMEAQHRGAVAEMKEDGGKLRYSNEAVREAETLLRCEASEGYRETVSDIRGKKMDIALLRAKCEACELMMKFLTAQVSASIPIIMQGGRA